MNHSFKRAHVVVSGICCVISTGATAQTADRDDAIEQLIVYGARQPIAAEHSGSAVTVLTREQIASDGRPTVGELLRGTPGVALSRSGGHGALTQLRMRGGEANHVAVFVDGVKVNDPSQSGEFDFSHLLSSDIETVEVIRGPQSALWGSDALSGVVNIVSARPREGMRASAAAEMGSADWNRLSGGIGTAGERGHIMFSAGHVATDGYNVSRAGDERDGYRNTSSSIAGAIDLARSVNMSMSLRSIDAHSDFDGTDLSTGFPADRANTIDKRQMLGAFRLTAESFDGRWRHEVRLDRLDTQNVTHTENSFALNGFDAARADAVVDTFAYQSGFEFSDVHRFVAAIERRDESFVQRGPISFGDPNRNEEMDTDSIVVEYDVRPTDDLSILISWRTDSNSEFDDAATKRISGAWRLGESGTRLRAAYGEGIKNPTFTERFGFFTDFLGNPGLRPERSRSGEIGLDHTLASARFRVSATLFDEVLEDEINGFVFDFANAAFTSVNQSGESKRQGLEFEGAWNPSDVFAVQFSWTSLEAEEFDASGQIAAREIRRPEQTANLSMQWHSVANRLSLALSFDYSSQQDDFFFPPVPPYQERITLDGFGLLTLSAQYEFDSALQLYGRIENGLDDTYEEVFGFRSNERQLFVGVRFRL